MQRRAFLTLAGASAAGLAHAAGLSPEAATDPWQQSFSQATASQPWTLAYANGRDREPVQAQVRGRFPAAVHGALYRNGPAIHALNGRRYHHFFDGDGMLQRYAIGPDGVRHTARVVRTAKYKAELAAGRRLYEGFGTKWPDARHVTGPDAFNAANTSVVRLGGELLALWEGGSAYAMDADSLQTLGVKHWSDQTQGAPFSAHPRVEPDGTAWNFGVSPTADELVLYEISPQGQLKRAGTVPTPYTAYVHDFAVTRRHLVFLLPPLVLDRERFAARQSFLESHVWRPELGTRVLVVDKADWSRRRWMELPSAFVFHLGNAWDDEAGTIHFDYVHAPDPQALQRTNQELMRGRVDHRPGYAIATAQLDLARGTARQELIQVQAEFPRIDPRLTGLRHRELLHATQTSDDHPGFCGVARTSVETGRSQAYSYGADHMAEEHLFIPEPGTAPGGPGWVLGTALDLRRGRTLLSCFDAARLDAGPVAQAELPDAMPLGLHATFVKST